MSGNFSCPYCQKPLNVAETVSERPFVCSHCLSNIENPRLAPASQAPNVLRDIRHPVHRNGWPLWLFVWVGASLCVGQIAYAKYENVAKQTNYHDIYSPGFLGLDLLSVLAIGRLLWICFLRKSQDATADRILSVLVLTVLLSLAVAVFFLVVCNVM
jgi:hypothetical protein